MRPVLEPPTCLLVLGAGEPWESTAVESGRPGSGLVVVKRCIDLTDLLATASSGQAQVAVVAAGADGLDRQAVEHLHQVGVRVVVVLAAEGPEHLAERGRLAGVDLLLPAAQITELGARLQALRPPTELTRSPEPAPRRAPGAAPAVAVWGPQGAPGRTTIALGLAGALAARGADPLLLDLDPAGGTVAQHLGVLDDVSGLLAASRRLSDGDLAGSFVALQRRVAGFRLLTGLPRGERWTEVAAGLAPELLALGRRQGPVVADLGSSIEDDAAAGYTGRAGRYDLTREALADADRLVVVGTADPVGLTRLARALGELRELRADVVPTVVVNRVRRSLGWDAAQLRALVTSWAPGTEPILVPEARSTLDRAMVAGRSVAELGDGELSRAFEAVTCALLPETPRAPRAGIRLRRAGRARRR